MLRVLVTAAIPSAALLAARHRGRWHPAGDPLAVFRAHLGVVVLACGSAMAMAMLGVRRLGGAVALGALIASSGPMALGSTVPEPARLVVCQKNLLHTSERVADVARDIRRTTPDVVLLQEPSTADEGIVAALADLYPHAHRCPM